MCCANCCSSIKTMTQVISSKFSGKREKVHCSIWRGKKIVVNKHQCRPANVSRFYMLAPRCMCYPCARRKITASGSETRTSRLLRSRGRLPVVAGFVRGRLLCAGAAQYPFPGLGVLCLPLGQGLDLRRGPVLAQGGPQRAVAHWPLQDADLRRRRRRQGVVLDHHGRPCWRSEGVIA